MEQEINRFTAYANCPSGEHWAIFSNSEVKKYPKGYREVLTFLILNDDKQTPKLNNKEEPYYSTIICNKSKGSSPKSKVNKIKRSMLSKEEYDPVNIHLGVPTIETFYNRKLKVKVCLKSNNKNFITHIHRPRDNQWECIEGEFEGKFITTTDPIEVFKSMKHTINRRELNYAEQSFYSLVNYYSDKEGKFIFNINQTDKTFFSTDLQRHEQILKFFETKDVVDLQNIIGGKLVK
ncbi:hypothetical protein N9M33_04635 [Candidatus Pelagibacter bacterium]|nr:hypothetical protein [Candidatus Pelagibacter bacterium]